MTVNAVNYFSSSVVAAGITAGLGAVVSSVCSGNPVTGAIFGATLSVVRSATHPIFEKMFHQPGANRASRFFGTCLKIVVPIVSAVAISSALGFPITLGASVAICSAPLVVALTVCAVALPIIVVVELMKPQRMGISSTIKS